MANLNPDELVVDTFQTTPTAPDAVAPEGPGVTNGVECTRSLDVLCTVNSACQTPRYNCV